MRRSPQKEVSAADYEKLQAEIAEFMALYR